MQVDAARLFETDDVILGALGRRIDGDGWRAWRTDAWPTWYDGNTVQVHALGGRGLDELEAIFRACFDAELHRHVSVSLAPGIEAEALLAEAERRGWIVGRDAWLLATAGPAPRPVPAGTTLRPIDLGDDDDWEAFNAAAVSAARSMPWFDDEARFRRFYAKHRPLSAALGLRWPALWGDDGELRAWLGWFEDRDLARAQNVMTLAPYRGRGYCGFLLRHALGEILARPGLRGWALCSEQGSAAHRLYLRHGFVELGRGASLLRLP